MPEVVRKSRLKLNGTSYSVTHYSDGTEGWEPSRPDGDAERCQSRLADVLESQQAPAAKDDTTFMSGRPRLRDSFKGDGIGFNAMLKGARKHGYEPKSTDVYMRSVARFPGDPSAFFNSGDGMGKIKKICEKRGVGCEGSVVVNAPEAKYDAAAKPTKKKKKVTFTPEV